MDIHKIQTSIPVNKEAALVTGKGIHFESEKKILNLHTRTPPPFCIWLPQYKANKALKEVIGRKFGSLTVLGYSKEESKGKNSAIYICRCVCGYYTGRRLKAIMNPKNNKDSCERCRETKHLRRKAEYLSTEKKI